MKFTFTQKIFFSIALIVFSFSGEKLIGQCFPSPATGPAGPTALEIREAIKDLSTCSGCTYLLALGDDDSADATAVSPGWDAASIDVIINEGAKTSYKVTTQQNDCALIPLCPSDGGFLDLEYWNGAFEAEHNFTLYKADGTIATDINGNLVQYIGSPPVGTLIRVKAECPAPVCADNTLDITFTPFNGNNVEPLFYEIMDAAGNVVYSEGPTTSANLEGGTVTLNKCETYTLVFGSSAGAGAAFNWDNVRMNVTASETEYNCKGPDINGDFHMFYYLRPTLGANGMEMNEFTIPCTPPEADRVDVLTNANCAYTGLLNLPLLEPSICYNTCHVDCGPTAVDVDVYLNGVVIDSYSYDYGIGITYSGPNFGNFPAGKHTLKYVFTYNCEQVGIRPIVDQVQVCRDVELLISSEANPVMACNNEVNITLNHDDEDCETEITPDMLLEDLDLCSNDEYSITINGIEGAIVTSDLACGTYQYEIVHCYSGNPCWGFITLEDKTAPTIICHDYELPCNHPEYLNEDYSAVESFCTNAAVVTKENVWVSANFNADFCAPHGEIIQDLCLNLDLDHTRPRDLRVRLITPYGTFNLPRAHLAPYCASDLLSPLAGLIGLPYDQAGTWRLQLLDTNSNNPPNDNPDRGIGYGKLLEACIDISHGFPTAVEAFDCTLQSLELINEMIVETNCDQSNWNGAQIMRTFQAVDKPGNSSVCTQTVNLKAPAISDLIFPADVTIECDGTPADELILEDEASFAFGCFEINETLQSLCDVSFTYSDLVVPKCGDSYEILRTWTIISWCSNVTKHHVQAIKVKDTQGPTLPFGDITITAGGYDCTGSVLLSDFGITDACSGLLSVTATYTDDNGQLQIVELINGNSLEDLPFGATNVEIKAKDNCLQVSTSNIIINVIDGTNPVAICNDNLHISLNSDGTARIFAEDFDEGSSDNCELASLQIRSLGCVGGSFDDYADVACCDLGNVRLELLVTDVHGNTNICWADVLVEDPLAPIVTCKPDVTLDCNDPAMHDPFTQPDALDNCSVSLLSVVDAGALDNCSAGTISRTWTYTDGSDKSPDQSCTQTITVNHVSDFTVQFPPDVTLTTCPSNIGDTGEPIILDDDCELVSIGHEDQILTLATDACYKIIRKWTITNWCINNTGMGTELGIPLPLPNTYRDDDGFFYYEQTIKVLDGEAPSISFTAPDPCDYSDGCEGSVNLIAGGEDDCSEGADLNFSYKIDLNADGSFDLSGNGNDASGSYPYGNHSIKWTLSDGCGNATSSTYDFEVKDCKNPSPVCLNGLALEVMNDGSGCTEIWASDLLEYAFDNCSSDEAVEASVLIRREGDTNAPTGVIEVCCADVPAGSVAVEVFVTDEAGNSDFCVTYIIAQDNLGNCPDAGTGTAMIAGDIMTEDYEEVEQVMVDVNFGTNSMPTGVNGYYSFPNLIVGNSFMIEPGKDINPLNGVTTYDLVLMSQHILGSAPLSSPYQLIAADINNSGTVTTFDIVQLRQLILYVISDLPANESWRFVDMDYVFPDPTNPWQEAFPEVINVTNLQNSGELLADFFAIKIGDVNGSATPNNILGTEDRNASSTLRFNLENSEVKAGDKFELNFTAEEFKNIFGYQFSLSFDKDLVEFIDTKSGAIAMSANNFGLALLDEGIITTSVNEAAAYSIENDEVLFTIEFLAKQTVLLSDVFNLNNKYASAEAYGAEGELLDLGLSFNTENTAVVLDGSSFELFQNSPNPFSEATSIAFNLPKASKVSLKVFDVDGKTLKLIEGDFNKGANVVSIDANDLGAKGVLFYTLKTEDHSATKKMIIID